MKGCLLIPEVYSGNFASFETYLPLFELIENNLGFDRIVCNDISPTKLKKYDVVMTFKSPQKNEPDLMKSLYKLPKSQKLIGYFIDLHPWHEKFKREEENNKFFEASEKLMERCDRIMYAYDEAFRNMWPQFVKKAEWFPQFVGNSDYSRRLPMNENPKNKCLVSGALGFYYPLRQTVLKKYGNFVENLNHPGYKIKTEEALRAGFKFKYDFLNTLYQYRCCLSSCAIVRYTLMKHFEIPSVGSLLLSDSCEDMKKLGFVHSVNYIHVDALNFGEVMSAIISYPGSFDHIRFNGRKFVLSNHTEYHRFEQFKRMLSKL